MSFLAPANQSVRIQQKVVSFWGLCQSDLRGNQQFAELRLTNELGRADHVLDAGAGRNSPRETKVDELDLRLATLLEHHVFGLEKVLITEYLFVLKLFCSVSYCFFFKFAVVVSLILRICLS